jgi:N(2)-fixation sustaining protein CowN
LGGSGLASSSKPKDASAPDRYVSFLNIDFEGNIAAVLGHLHRYIDDPETGNAFWDRFKQRLGRCEAGEAGVADKLLLLHAHVYYMVELFEEHDDADALAALKKLEEECF